MKCGNPDCENSHGPYLYAYWKQDKKLKKRYVGKNLEDFGLRKIAKEVKLRLSQHIKFKFIQEEAGKGNVLAKQYLEKLRNEEVSIDWGPRVLINRIRQQRMLKMIAIADDRHFSYDNEIELVQFIASEMQKEHEHEREQISNSFFVRLTILASLPIIPKYRLYKKSS